MPVGRRVLGRILNVIGEPVDERGPVQGRRSAARSTARRRRSSTRATKVEIFETGIKVIDLLAPYRKRRQDRACSAAPASARPCVIMELINNIAKAARRLLGVRRRRRAHPRGQRPLPRDDRVRRHRPGRPVKSKVALVYGQMNEPPGARARVGLSAPDHGRVLPRRRRPGRAALHRQHLPLHPGRLRGVGAARPHPVGRRLPADPGHRDGRAAGAHHLDQEGLDHLGAGHLRARRRPDRPGAGHSLRPPRRHHRALARDRRNWASIRRSTRSTPPRPPARPAGRRRGALRRRARGAAASCSATRSCRTSSPSSAWTSSPTRTS